MSTSIVLCESLYPVKQYPGGNVLHSSYSAKFFVRMSGKSRKFCGFVPYAKKNHSRRKRSWWQKFFFDDDGNWLGLKDDDMLEDELSDGSSDEELSEEEKFEAWKRRAEAIVELREAQEDMLNEESRRWEDWVVDENGNNYDYGNGSWWTPDLDGNGGVGSSVEDVRSDPGELVPQKGFVDTVRDIVLGREEDDILYEDRVFRYASLNSVSDLCTVFFCLKLTIPCAIFQCFSFDYNAFMCHHI